MDKAMDKGNVHIVQRYCVWLRYIAIAGVGTVKRRNQFFEVVYARCCFNNLDCLGTFSLFQRDTLQLMKRHVNITTLQSIKNEVGQHGKLCMNDIRPRTNMVWFSGSACNDASCTFNGNKCSGNDKSQRWKCEKGLSTTCRHEKHSVWGINNFMRREEGKKKYTSKIATNLAV